MDDEADTVYPIKYIDDASETATRPVIVGKRTNAGDSYSALAAIFNTLLLRRDVSLPSFGAESIGSGEMKTLIGKNVNGSGQVICRGDFVTSLVHFGFARLDYYVVPW